MIRLAKRGEIPRKGSLVGAGEFEIHGAGCIVIDATGRIVDVDFMEGQVAIFDTWRLRRFVASSGGGLLAGDDETLQICRELVAEGLLREPRDGWFAVS